MDPATSAHLAGLEDRVRVARRRVDRTSRVAVPSRSSWRLSMPAPVLMFGGVIGLLLGEAAQKAATSPVVTLLVALLGGGAATAAVGAYFRRRSGEGPAAAAKDLIDAGAKLVDASESLTAPLQTRIVELSRQVSEGAEKYASARADAAVAGIEFAEREAAHVREVAALRQEKHTLASDLAAKAAEAEVLRLERDSLRDQMGIQSGRRSTDP